MENFLYIYSIILHVYIYIYIYIYIYEEVTIQKKERYKVGEKRKKDS